MDMYVLAHGSLTGSSSGRKTALSTGWGAHPPSGAASSASAWVRLGRRQPASQDWGTGRVGGSRWCRQEPACRGPAHCGRCSVGAGRASGKKVPSNNVPLRGVAPIRPVSGRL